MSKKQIRPIAIYLPQFHPIPENDEWWGKGFTEWSNVVKAKPLYKNHYQPHLPSDLGFYDLRLEEARLAQEALAKEYGVDGFCYYHYWFNGKRMLHEPVDRKLTNPKEDFPFMLCWANENWTRRWDGLEQEILIKQEYNEDDDIKHMHYLIDFFRDPRYIKVDGKPVFVLYKHFLLPNATETAKTWRKIAAEYGIELYLCHMVFGYQKQKVELIEGFDAAIDFEPFSIRRENIFNEIRKKQKENLSYYKHLIPKSKFINRGSFLGKIISPPLNKIPYNWMIENQKPIQSLDFKIYPSVVPSWDNTARRKDQPTLILDNSTPTYFGKWLKKITDEFKPYSKEENFIFINAWNEWAEGNHLEPCQKWGNKYLLEIKNSQ